MKNYNKEIISIINHKNFKNLELFEIVSLIRKIKWVRPQDLEEQINYTLEYINQKIQNKDHAINKKITNMLKTKHVPKEIWDDIWFLKIRDFRNFKIVLCLLIEIENKVELKKQYEYIKNIKESTWLTVHKIWKSYLFNLVCFERKYKIKKSDECVIFDIEFDMQNGREQIIEICAIKFKNYNITSKFSALVKNNYPLGNTFVKITNIKPYMLKYKPTDTNALTRFFNYIKNSDVLIGFAFKNNDIPMLKRFDLHKKINNFSIDKYKILDLQELLATNKHEQRSLSYYVDLFDVEKDEQSLHRAGYDCDLMYDVLMELDYLDIEVSKTEL